jgi:prevent-host-death family protein
LKNNAAEVVRDAHENGRLMIVTQNGEAKAVVMGVEQYDEWKRTLALLKLIAQGEAEIAVGRLIGQDEAFGRAKAGMQKAAAGE